MKEGVPRLLLSGGGHAHLEVVRRLARCPDVNATLVNPERWADYSGMLPGLVAGHYRVEQTRIDLAALCARSRVAFEVGRVVELRPEAGEAICVGGARHDFDIVSLDTGATPRLSEMPGALEHAVAVKPVPQFVERWQAFLSAVHGESAAVRVVVAGAGAGGVELVLAMRQELVRANPSARLALVSEELLHGHAERARRAVRRVLQERGISLHPERVMSVTPGQVHLTSGAALPADFIVISTGVKGPAWLGRTELALDAGGFVAVNAHLQSVSHENVFAAGDVATIVEKPLPKSGVYAVRAGPVLFENLMDRLGGRPLRAELRPQRRTLALISLGDKRATLSYGNLALSGSWVWRWKDRIDRRFVGKYAPP